MPDLVAGTLLHERYRAIRPLGKGGMGAVYEAVDTRLHNTVAVKLMTLSGAEANRAFEREATLLAALRHPALPVVIDYFVEDERQFLVMQYIEGEDLAHALQRLAGPFAADELLRCALALAGALAYLHRRDPPIVHRDLKPANVNRTPAGEYVLLDFGLAKGRQPDMTVPADERSVYGFTPTYSPPEQIQGLATDPRSDIFAFGATLFHLAAAVPPPTAVERLNRVAGGGSDPLAYRLLAVRGLDVRMQGVIARALALDPGDRFQSVREIIDALGGESARRPAPLPAPEIAPDKRRVDAALPSRAEVGRPIDLIVQVRFADSPSLGLEDWPSRRRPERIEQASEALDVSYPTDPATGARMAARLRIRVVAPDFTLAGGAEQLVDVPPREYSKRLAFLLTPVRDGVCRVNVEVYATDAVFLGVIAVEAEALYAGIAESTLRVATIDLQVGARRALNADENTSGMSSDAADPARVIAAATASEATARLDAATLAASASIAEARAPAERKSKMAPRLPAADRAPMATPAAKPPQPASSSPASSTPSSSSSMRKWIAVATAAIVLIAAGVTMLAPRLGDSQMSPRTTTQQVPSAASTNVTAERLPDAAPLQPPGGTDASGGSPKPVAAAAPPPAAPQATQPQPPASPSKAPTPPAAATEAAPAIGPRLPATMSGAFRAVVNNVPPVTFDDGTGCEFTLTLQNIEATIDVRRGTVMNGHLTARAVRRPQTPCTKAEAKSELSYAFRLSRASALSGAFLFAADTSNDLNSREVEFFRRTVEDNAIRGSFLWVRRAESPNWTVQIDGVFRRQ